MPHTEIADTIIPMSTRSADPAHRLDSLRRRRLSRRSLLAASARAGVGAGALALVGCADDESAQQGQEGQPAQAAAQQQSQAQATAAQTQAQQAEQQQTAEQAEAQSAPPSGPSSGGVIRMWLPVERHDRWDPHRSRYRYTQAALSLMYNRLIQPASVSSGELEADLCALPEMPDETTYVFTIEPGAVFWDLEPTNGRALTAQDIAWNVQRQRDALDAAGLPDPHFFRRAAYDRTASTEATSDSSISLTTAEPDAAYLASVHASPFAWITSPEAAELYGDDWRDDPSEIMRSSGSGPYTPRLYSGFELTLARSENWWRPDSAWADGITFSSGDTNSIAGLYDRGGNRPRGFPADQRDGRGAAGTVSGASDVSSFRWTRRSNCSRRSAIRASRERSAWRSIAPGCWSGCTAAMVAPRGRCPGSLTVGA